MKSIRYSFIAVLIAAISFVSCKKSSVDQLLADAGATITVQLPKDTVTISGSVTSGQTTNMSYLWSTISGPNSPVIVNNTSITASISGLIAGTYVFQFQVTNSNGTIAVDTTSITVLPANIVTLPIIANNVVYDGRVDSYNATGTNTNPDIEIASGTIGGVPTSWRSYLKFDLSQIPVSATITSVTLYLYSDPTPLFANNTPAQSGTANAYYVERITGNWNPASFSWSSLPPTTTLNRVLVPTSTSTTQNAIIDVTALVQDMQANGNYGFGFRLQNEVAYNYRSYAGSRYSDSTLYPKLIVTYH